MHRPFIYEQCCISFCTNVTHIPNDQSFDTEGKTENKDLNIFLHVWDYGAASGWQDFLKLWSCLRALPRGTDLQNKILSIQ